MCEVEHEKLPENVKPVSYDIHITTDLKGYEFWGHERIVIDVKEKSETITFHSKDLTIPKESVVLHIGDEAIPVVDLTFVEDNDSCTVKLPRAIEPGTAGVALELDFKAPLRDILCGYYRAPYDVVDEKTGEKIHKYMGVTQFEATDARRAFPCWDEPERKATFLLSLTFDSSLMALSNMPVESEKDNGNGTKTVHFQRTPIMSTYLLAFIVGEFDFVTKKNEHGVQVSVYTPPGKSEQARFALDMGAWCLDFYSDYFGIDFPLPKCDMVAITNFEAGAMENWGLVTYRERALLFDEATSTTRIKAYVASVVAHELAHQWFGNLVTMKWWNDLWLNEGFATYMQFFATGKRFPEWQFWTRFLLEEFLDGIALDAKPSTHKISLPVSKTCDITQMFDPISYSKGASVIRMLATHIGEEKFRDGLRVYLQRHKYSNTSTSDLWKAISEVSGVDVANLMYGWTNRPGFPIIRVSRDAATGAITLKQERMYSVPPEEKKEDAETVWWVPLHFDSNNPGWKSRSVVVREKEVTLRDVPLKEGEWLKVNGGQTEFVRVLYEDAGMFDALCRAMRSKELTCDDRVGFLSDTFALSRAGYVKPRNAFKAALALDEEEESTVIDELASDVAGVQSLFAGTEDLAEAGSKFARRVFRKMGKTFGLEPKEGESELVTLARSTVLARLALAGEEEYVMVAMDLFQKDCDGTSKLSKDMRSLVHRVVMRSGTKEQQDTLINLYRTTSVLDEKLSVIGSLGSVQDEKRAEELLNWALLSGEVKTQDMIYIFRGMGSSQGAVLWKFTQEHWDWLHNTFKDSMYTFGSVLASVICGASDAAMIDVFHKFFADKDVSSASLSVEHAYATVLSKSRWLKQCREDNILGWVNENC